MMTTTFESPSSDATAHDFSNIYTYEFNDEAETAEDEEISLVNSSSRPSTLNTPLLIAQDASGASGIGSTIWDAAIVLAKYFEKIQKMQHLRIVTSSKAVEQHTSVGGPIRSFKDTQMRPSPFQSSVRVVEIGAGCGLNGLVAARLFPAIKEVVLTDKPGSLDLLRHNARENFPSDCESGRIRVEDLQWGDETRAKELGLFDVILAADCVCVR
ncbi:hypothetical protein HDU93_000528 [Gonapodya sp. JEL0774]|nr:hypothetical protein HDU93_000528 [Gonapodya sp. JEL0774]